MLLTSPLTLLLTEHYTEFYTRFKPNTYSVFLYFVTRILTTFHALIQLYIMCDCVCSTIFQYLLSMSVYIRPFNQFQTKKNLI